MLPSVVQSPPELDFLLVTGTSANRFEETMGQVAQKLRSRPSFSPSPQASSVM